MFYNIIILFNSYYIINNLDYKDSKLLDHFIAGLNYPDLVENQEGKKSKRLWSLGSKLATGISRLGQKSIGSLCYDEAKARQLLLEYINNPDCTETLRPQHAKIMLLYDRLLHLANGKGTWADGIDRVQLEAKGEYVIGERVCNRRVCKRRKCRGRGRRSRGPFIKTDSR